MGQYLFAIPELCTGCHRCVYACSAAKEGKIFPSKSRIQINNFPEKGFSFPSICFHCPKPECVAACPKKAIYKNPAGAIIVDKEKCDRCGDCVDACPYGMIFFDDDGHVFKCDLCGGKPACVSECHPKALVFVSDDKKLKKIRLVQMKQRMSSGSPSERRHNIGKKILELTRF
jgi:Fe-S-cluster-containing dehydrogenase component